MPEKRSISQWFGPILSLIPSVLITSSTDGIKLRMGPNHWLMLRFSGTEPLLRLYCEGPDAVRVNEVLAWAREFAEAA